MRKVNRERRCHPPRRRQPRHLRRRQRRLPTRICHGRPAILALRILGALALAEITLRSGAGAAPIAGVMTGNRHLAGDHR